MPPPDKTPESQLRYFLRLLAAICAEGGNELRIPMSALRRLDAEGSRQALIEDSDTEKDELVLRFGTKHSAMYPVEPECLRPATPTPQPQPSQPQQPSSPVSSPLPSRKPLTVNELAKAELKIRRLRMAAQIKVEQQAKARAAATQSAQDIEELLRMGE